MVKSGARSVTTPNVVGNAGSGAQAVSTHPGTRVPGSTAPTQQPVPDIKAAEALRQKPQNPQQPVSITNLPTNESNASSLQVPLDPAARVKTEH
jgi:hypothetical protein